VCDVEVIKPFAGAIPTHMTFTVGLAECGLAKLDLTAHRRHADAVPIAADPATTPPSSQRLRSWVSGPNIKGSSKATGAPPSK